MIYKDIYSINDYDTQPENRREPCLNCGQLWSQHNGWACKSASTFSCSFLNIPSEYRYLTESMVRSIKETIVSKVEFTVSVVRKETDISDWKFWAQTEPGQCACAIPKEQCSYHNG